ncbi:hypothetical protein [uncultured Tateyamaria sp.]|uniref:hypothetical protein n=1 Tax=uncultured Tateyamaria sp. TaxID=455651 RepID=UPI00263070E9|nr:hypothetical protein [uncultured Tateyamaria sp.]
MFVQCLAAYDAMVRRAMPPSAAPLDAGQFGRDADTRRTETYGSCSPKPSLDLASQVTAGRTKRSCASHEAMSAFVDAGAAVIAGSVENML